MNKSDLIEALAVKENLTENQATDTINLVFTGFYGCSEKGRQNRNQGVWEFYGEGI
jgi:nucleoid DNA-binding protein